MTVAYLTARKKMKSEEKPDKFKAHSNPGSFKIQPNCSLVICPPDFFSGHYRI
jgi:hypothetical protein